MTIDYIYDISRTSLKFEKFSNTISRLLCLVLWLCPLASAGMWAFLFFSFPYLRSQASPHARTHARTQQPELSGIQNAIVRSATRWLRVASAEKNYEKPPISPTQEVSRLTGTRACWKNRDCCRAGVISWGKIRRYECWSALQFQRYERVSKNKRKQNIQKKRNK